MKGLGSGWSRQTCRLYTTPGFQAFSSGKVMFSFILRCEFINFGTRSHQPDLQGRAEIFLKYDISMRMYNVKYM